MKEKSKRGIETWGPHNIRKKTEIGTISPHTIAREARSSIATFRNSARVNGSQFGAVLNTVGIIKFGEGEKNRQETLV